MHQVGVYDMDKDSLKSIKKTFLSPCFLVGYLIFDVLGFSHVLFRVGAFVAVAVTVLSLSRVCL